jgi:hypothetical protein
VGCENPAMRQFRAMRALLPTTNTAIIEPYMYIDDL